MSRKSISCQFFLFWGIHYYFPIYHQISLKFIPIEFHGNPVKTLGVRMRSLKKRWKCKMLISKCLTSSWSESLKLDRYQFNKCQSNCVPTMKTLAYGLLLSLKKINCLPLCLCLRYPPFAHNLSSHISGVSTNQVSRESHELSRRQWRYFQWQEI